MFYEEQFRAKYPNCTIEEERVSEHLTRFTLFVGSQPVAESANRILAFKFALQDIRDGLLVIFDQGANNASGISGSVSAHL